MTKPELPPVRALGDERVESLPDVLLGEDGPGSEIGALPDRGGIDFDLPVKRHLVRGTRERSPQLCKLPLLDLVGAECIRPDQLGETGAERPAVADTGLAQPVRGRSGVLKRHGQPVVDPLRGALHGARSTCPTQPKWGEKRSVSVSSGSGPFHSGRSLLT